MGAVLTGPGTSHQGEAEEAADAANRVREALEAPFLAARSATAATAAAANSELERARAEEEAAAAIADAVIVAEEEHAAADAAAARNRVELRSWLDKERTQARSAAAAPARTHHAGQKQLSCAVIPLRGHTLGAPQTRTAAGAEELGEGGLPLSVREQSRARRRQEAAAGSGAGAEGAGKQRRAAKAPGEAGKQQAAAASAAAAAGEAFDYNTARSLLLPMGGGVALLQSAVDEHTKARQNIRPVEHNPSEDCSPRHRGAQAVSDHTH